MTSNDPNSERHRELPPLDARAQELADLYGTSVEKARDYLRYRDVGSEMLRKLARELGFQDTHESGRASAAGPGSGLNTGQNEDTQQSGGQIGDTHHSASEHAGMGGAKLPRLFNMAGFERLQDWLHEQLALRLAVKLNQESTVQHPTAMLGARLYHPIEEHQIGPRQEAEMNPLQVSVDWPAVVTRLVGMVRYEGPGSGAFVDELVREIMNGERAVFKINGREPSVSIDVVLSRAKELSVRPVPLTAEEHEQDKEYGAERIRIKLEALAAEQNSGTSTVSVPVATKQMALGYQELYDRALASGHLGHPPTQLGILAAAVAKYGGQGPPPERLAATETALIHQLDRARDRLVKMGHPPLLPDQSGTATDAGGQPKAGLSSGTSKDVSPMLRVNLQSFERISYLLQAINERREALLSFLGA